jgi:hypothetical protein
MEALGYYYGLAKSVLRFEKSGDGNRKFKQYPLPYYRFDAETRQWKVDAKELHARAKSGDSDLSELASLTPEAIAALIST